jgi:Beta-propeller repeat
VRAPLVLAALVVSLIAGSVTHLSTALSAPSNDVSVIFGGNGFDTGLGTTDSMGNTYVTGGTESSDFPVSSQAAQTQYGGAGDAFVAKIGPDGKIIYTTYLGGSGLDEGRGIAVDSAGYLWVSGYTESSDFPTREAADTTLGGSSDGFIARLAPDGSLASSTFLGANGADRAYALALDAAGNAYVTGRTTGSNFPTTPGAFDQTPNGDFDAFVTKFSPSAAILYSSLLGGPGFDDGLAMTVDRAGSVFVTGKASDGYPVTPGAFDTTQNGDYDMFVTKLDPSGSALTYSTYVGGDSWDEGLGIAVDGDGNAYFTGNVQSPNYPVTPGAVGGALKGSVGAAATKLNPAGSALVYSGVIGGSAWDEGSALSIDSKGAAYIAGHQASSDFPTTEGALDRTFGGEVDGFLTKVDPSGTELLYSTFVGGNGWDGVMAMAVDDAGRAYLTGGTSSGDYPGTFVGGSRGSHDVFSTTINTVASAPPAEPDPEPAFTLSVAPAMQAIVRGDAATYTAVVAKDDPTQSVALLSIAGLPEGATATLVQSGDDSTTITVQTSESTPLGSYDLTVIGRSGNVTRTATVQLDIHCCPPPG